jgi:RNA polymerase-binding transcription factor DksA
MAKKSPTRSAKKKSPAKKTTKKATAKVAKKTVKKPVKKVAKKAVKKAAPPKKTPVKKAPAKKKTPAKKTAAKAVAKKKIKPSKTAKKTAVKKKTATKKTAAKKKAVVKKTAPKKSVKKTPAKKSPAKKAAAKKAPLKKKTPAKAATKKKTAAPKAEPVKAAVTTTRAKASTKKVAKAGLKSRLLGKSKPSKSSSIGFSLDEVKEIAKKSKTTKKEIAKNNAAKAKEKAAAIEASVKAAKPTKVAAASLADILGFNPAGGGKATYDDPKSVPAKYRRYYKILLDLRTHLTGQIDQHSEETLKRSSKDDAGDLSSYGQHMADAGTDTFDRDFALSLVANEQEALSEIEAAIQRIKNGTFGMDEITGEPIDKDRLIAVPFTRYSAKTQKDLERNRHRVRTQAGLSGEMGDNTMAITDPNADE